jgi:hypothetical protein
MNTLSASSSDEQFRRRFSLAEEDRRGSANPPMWNGSDRWFRSPKVIDLWHSVARRRRTELSISPGSVGVELTVVCRFGRRQHAAASARGHRGRAC